MDIKYIDFSELTQREQRDMEKVKTQMERSGINLNSYGVYEPAPAVTRETYEKALSEITPWYENIPQKDNKAELLARTKEKVHTERADKYFEKAIKAGFMRQEGEGYKWLFNGGSKASLAYFVVKIYDPDDDKSGKIPFKGLENLFSMKRLDRAILDIPLSTPKWREKMDDFFK